MSSGSLGQGLSAGVGMALSAKIDKKSYRTYVLCGDGEIEEGQIWEAAMFAGASIIIKVLVYVHNNNPAVIAAEEEQYETMKKRLQYIYE